MKLKESISQDKVHYLLSIFDDLDEPVYVCDPETNKILYMVFIVDDSSHPISGWQGCLC